MNQERLDRIGLLSRDEAIFAGTGGQFAHHLSHCKDTMLNIVRA